uniref:PAX3- and PAX7-binding protein 1 n=1 Tax=Cacopsylla melanoneura TaxID=428564 RepID=A0A8D8U288_9HEMI
MKYEPWSTIIQTEPKTNKKKKKNPKPTNFLIPTPSTPYPLSQQIPVLVGLEQRILALVERQAAGLIARRRQDVKDQAEEMSPANLSNKILGLGNARNLSEELTRRIAEREGRRIRRMRAREKAGEGGGQGQSQGQQHHIEGMSSDEEVTEAESSAFRLQRETIESDARIVFEDVNEEFSLVECVVAKFARWKKFEPDQYGDAYVSLCLCKILGPFVRFKLLFWNPLTQPLKSLEEERWYRSLLLYGLTSSETEESLVRDPDVMLLPKVVEKVILTKIEVIVKAAYNPLSTSQTVCLIGTLSKLLQDFPTLDGDCKILNCVLEATVDRLRTAVDDDVFIPIYMNDVESGRTSLFFQRQFASAIKLLGNIVRWQGLLSNDIVIQIGIDSLLNRYLILGLRTFTDPLVAAEKCKMISNVLPRSWLNSNSGISQLEMFIRQVRQITEKLKNAS